MSNTVYVSHVIDAPAETVWGIMRDFNGMPSYHPGIWKGEIERGGRRDEVGCVRHLTLSDGFAREQLLCLNDLNYALAYKIIDGTISVRATWQASSCAESPKATARSPNSGPISK